MDVGAALEEELDAGDVALGGGAVERREHAVDRLVVDRRAVVQQELGGLNEALRAAEDDRGVERGEAVGLAVHTAGRAGEWGVRPPCVARSSRMSGEVAETHVMFALLRSSSATVSLWPLLHAISSGVLSEIWERR